MILKKYKFFDHYMKIALNEAENAYEMNEVPVGCVIVERSSKRIVAKTHNLMEFTQNPNMHAEILAIEEACRQKGSKNLSDCDIYVTLEPCTMCVSAISNARLKRLYYGAPDQKQGAVENGVRFYTSKSCMYRPEIYSDINSDEAYKIIKKFFSNLRKN